MAGGLFAFIEHAYLPPIKAADVLFWSILWSVALKYRKRKTVNWWCQHTTFMCLGWAVILILQMLTFVSTMSKSAADQQALLGDRAGENITQCINTWKNEESLDGYPFLSLFAASTPIFAVITFIVSACCTIRHIWHAKPTDLWQQKNRFMTIMILQLPVVYNICALYAVELGVRQARLGEYFCVLKDDDTEFQYESALSMGDAYEGIALLLFAEITMNVIQSTVDDVVEEAQKHQQQIEDADPEARKIMVKLEKMSEKLSDSTWSLGTLGIMYFSLICIVIGVPGLVACQLKLVGVTWLYSPIKTFAERWESTLNGMGLMGSCVAIHNMVAIEKKMDHAFLQGFETTLKFISVKIMVSILFVQQLVLPVFELSAPRTQLLDATLRSLEFCLIAFFNIRAWPAKHRFHRQEIHEKRAFSDAELEESLLVTRGASGETE